MNLSNTLFSTENITPGADILDVGCGTGQTAAYLATAYQARLTGIDIHPVMIKKAQKRMQKRRLPVRLLHGSI
ncbi:class I SAM-dependent methyltransferase, partial [Bacillus paralicheniformis]|uniref:class I SAM-dependent methyltransferase n=1 Tax=Bacillus paralicheniformis TaxID=1648923 RepID=UPI0020C1474B